MQIKVDRALGCSKTLKKAWRESRIQEVLHALPTMPAKVIAERI